MEGSILIRVDGNSEVGLGHLVRCFALAQMLRNHFRITFFCKFIPDSFSRELSLNGFSLNRVESENDFIDLLDNGKIVVLDGDMFSLSCQGKIKEKGAVLVCIDDLHDREFYADLIINHSPGIVAQSYKAQLWTKYALGPDYSLLRPPFLKASRKERLNFKTESILICFGGADPKNFTRKVLEVVVNFKQFKKIIIITGPAYSFNNDLRPIIESDNRINHLHSLDENQMAAELLKTDVAVVPASGVLLEAMACQVVPVSGIYADNQKYLYEHYKTLNCFIDAHQFSSDDLLVGIMKCINNPAITLNNLIDGQSGTRILKLIQELRNENELAIRRAVADDINATYKWAIDPKVRVYSFHRTIIERKEHEEWFNFKLDNPSCFYYICEMNGRPIGSIRFDIIDEEAIVSYLLDSLVHGKGLGVAILTIGIKTFIGDVEFGAVNKISGYVMNTNKASIQTFKRLGFVQVQFNSHLKFEKRLSYA